MSLSGANGLSGVNPQLLVGASARTASGTVNFASNVNTVNPASQSSGVFIGGLNQLTYSGVGGFDATGHLIAGLNYTVISAASQTIPLAFGVEGKFQVDAGTVTNGASGRFGLADVAVGATLTTWTGASIGITDSKGTLTNVKGTDFSITAITGAAISNCFAHNVQDVASAKATSFAALRSQITAKTGHFCIYSDGNAQSAHVGKFRIGSTTAPSATLDVTGTGAFSSLLTTAASATGGAGLNIPHGAAPTSPVNGDIWTTTTGLFARINGATVGPYT